MSDSRRIEVRDGKPWEITQVHISQDAVNVTAPDYYLCGEEAGSNEFAIKNGDARASLSQVLINSVVPTEGVHPRDHDIFICEECVNELLLSYQELSAEYELLRRNYDFLKRTVRRLQGKVIALTPRKPRKTQHFSMRAAIEEQQAQNKAKKTTKKSKKAKKPKGQQTRKRSVAGRRVEDVRLPDEPIVVPARDDDPVPVS